MKYIPLKSCAFRQSRPLTDKSRPAVPIDCDQCGAMTGIAACCAPAASGQAAAPPIRPMNSRRLMHRPLRQRTAAYHVVEYAALCITTKNDADVRYKSIATDPFRVSAEQCPLRSESDHHPSRDRLTLPPDVALTAESVSASPSGLSLIVVGRRVSCRSASGVRGDATSRRRVRLWGKSTRSLHGIKKQRNFPSSCLGGAT